jgi:hypothetical protein
MNFVSAFSKQKGSTETQVTLGILNHGNHLLVGLCPAFELGVIGSCR